jgi:lipopolysaccharide export system protein LptA
MTGDGRLDLEGEGFTWWKTNNDLVISNRVQTRVRRPVSRGGPSDPLASQDLRVTADRVRFSYPSNRVVYSGHVRVEDPRTQMTCGRLTIVRSAAGGIDRMVAEDDVVMVDRLGGGRATARTAEYWVDGERETVELTGDPRFQEGVREGTAERFVLDRRSHTLRAIGDARLVFPVGAKGAPGMPALLGPGMRPAAGETNRLIELSAAHITILLPATNGPVRGVVAETNVVLLDRQQNGRATAQRASYREDSGVELSGHPVWSADGQSLQGDLMRYDLARQVFGVTGGVLVRLPVQTLSGPLRTIEGALARTNATGGSNQVVEIRSRALQYREPWLEFEGETQAELLAGPTKLGQLQCATLRVQYSNTVQQVQAAGGVRLEQTPTPPGERGTTTRAVQCETLTAGFDSAGQLERLRATGGVDARQSDTRSANRPPVSKRLQCETVEARFWGQSNLVEWATAERNVVVSQDDRMVRGERALYTGTNSLLRLVGHPTVMLPEGRITEADTITWNRATGQYRIVGQFKSHWKSLPGITNLPTLPRIP